MKKRLFLIPIVILKTRTGYNAFSPVLDGCVATDKSIDRTLSRMRDTLEFHVEGMALVKEMKKFPEKILKKSFDNYGTDAFYATLTIAA